LEFRLQHPAIRNSTYPLFENCHTTPPVHTAAASSPSPELLIQGWRGEEVRSKFEMGRAEEQELQILAQSLDRRRRYRIHGLDGRVAKCRQMDSATSSPRIPGRMSWPPGVCFGIIFSACWRRGVRHPMVFCSGRSHGLSSAWDGGLNPLECRALPRGRTSPTLAKQGASHRVQE